MKVESVQSGQISLGSEPISFGPFQIDVARRQVLRDGANLTLRNQAFHVLKVLARNMGQYVDYQELIREAWDGTTVSRHTVASTVGAVREALREYGSWISYKPKLGYRLEVPGSEDLIRTGWHLWSRRTREGFERALEHFQEAAQREPLNARAFFGMARSHFTLAIYGMRLPYDMWEQFRAALSRAVELGGWTAQAHADLGWGLYLFEGRIEEAQSHLESAKQQDSSLAPPYLYETMLNASLRRLDAALESLARAREIEPLQPTLPATEVFLRFCRREFDVAAEAGRKGLNLHPYLHLGRTYYAQALEYAGDVLEALAQYRLARVISPDIHWIPALEARCLARNGQRNAATTIAAELEETRLSEYVDAYYIALLSEALGQRDEAMNELERAVEEHSATLFMLDVDPKMDALRKHPRFACLRDKLFRRRGFREGHAPGIDDWNDPSSSP